MAHGRPAGKGGPDDAATSPRARRRLGLRAWVCVANPNRRDSMRSITAAVGLVVLAGCTSTQRPAPVGRAAVSAATCDSAASIARERAHLSAVARTLGEISNGA